MAAARLDQLVLKGSHNAYQAHLNVEPRWQVDGYGVWAVELDYAVTPDAEHLVVVGHDAAGFGPDNDFVFAPRGSYLLSEYLVSLADSEAFEYRPIIVYLDNHYDQWGVNWGDDPNALPPDSIKTLGALMDTTIEKAVPNRVLLPSSVGAYLPTVVELVGRMILISCQAQPIGRYIFGSSLLPAYVPPDQVITQDPSLALSYGTVSLPKHPRRTFGPSPTENFNVWRTDNFTDDWTYLYGAPPNPLVVSATASPDPLIPNVASRPGQAVRGSQQGTRVLPFGTLRQAVDAASAPMTFVDGTGVQSTFPIGASFTVLVPPDTPIAEPLRIRGLPLTIKPDTSPP